MSVWKDWYKWRQDFNNRLNSTPRFLKLNDKNSEKYHWLDAKIEPILVLVETGEESALSSLRVNSLVKERQAYGIEFISSPGV